MALASTKTMDALKSIGLNSYERRIWVALLVKGISSVGNIADLANVPRSRSYDILQSLADKGFVVLQPGRPLRVVAVAPDEALERVKKRIEEEFRSIVERIDDLKESSAMRELREIYQRGIKAVKPEEVTGALKGKYSVFQQLSTMFKGASKNISVVTTPEGLNELANNHFEILRKAREKGVEIKIASVVNENTLNAIKTLSSVAEIRSLNEKDIPIYGRFAIVDGREILLGLADSNVESTQDLALWSRSEHTASKVLLPLFKLLWEHSKPIKR